VGLETIIVKSKIPSSKEGKETLQSHMYRVEVEVEVPAHHHKGKGNPLESHIHVGPGDSNKKAQIFDLLAHPKIKRKPCKAS
jgi:hypothetical protein